MKNTFVRKGFTLVEVLLVVVIVAILAGIVIVAINPAKQIAQTNNAQRRTDVNTIVNAVHQYGIANRGAFPDVNGADEGNGLPSTATVIGSAVGQVDLCSALVPEYIAGMPFDPTYTDAEYTDCTDYLTGYNFSLANGRITVAAPSAEESETISVTK